MTENEGRVEICYSRRWSRICGAGWDRIETRITCGELGFRCIYTNKKIAVMTDKQNNNYHADGVPVDYGRGSGQIYRPSFSCDGHETHLQYCSYSGYCYSSEDAGVICHNSQQMVIPSECAC